MKIMRTAVALLLAVGLCNCAQEQNEKDSATLLKQGWYSYQLGEFKKAIDHFDLALEITPESDPLYPDVLYGLATTWNLRRPGENPDLAAEYYERLGKNYPDSELSSWALLALARMQHLVPVGKSPEYDQVREAYRKVIQKNPDHQAADEAFLYLQASHVQDLEEASAKQVIMDVSTFIETTPNSKFVSPCYSILATCYEVLDQPKEQLQAELDAYKTAEIDPTNPFQDNSWRYWKLATLAEFGTGNFETARTYYQKLLDEYPQDIRKYAAMQALIRMDDIEEQIRQELKQGS